MDIKRTKSINFNRTNIETKREIKTSTNATNNTTSSHLDNKITNIRQKKYQIYMKNHLFE